MLEPSPDRVDSLCPIAGVDGSGCCDLAFAAPDAARRLKGDVVANQLERLGGYEWAGAAEEVGHGRCDGVAHPGASGRRRSADRRPVAPGFTATTAANWSPTCRARRCPTGMLAGLDGATVAAGCAAARRARRRRARGTSCRTGPRSDRKASTQAVEGAYEATQRVGDRTWTRAGHRVLAGASRRRAASTARWCGSGPGSAPGMTAWDLYGGAGVFAAVLADAVGETRARAHRRHLARLRRGRRGLRSPTSGGWRCSPNRCAAR